MKSVKSPGERNKENCKDFLNTCSFSSLRLHVWKTAGSHPSGGLRVGFLLVYS
jgi:hypothetical protein